MIFQIDFVLLGSRYIDFVPLKDSLLPIPKEQFKIQKPKISSDEQIPGIKIYVQIQMHVMNFLKFAFSSSLSHLLFSLVIHRPDASALLRLLPFLHRKEPFCWGSLCLMWLNPFKIVLCSQEKHILFKICQLEVSLGADQSRQSFETYRSWIDFSSLKTHKSACFWWDWRERLLQSHQPACKHWSFFCSGRINTQHLTPPLSQVTIYQHLCHRTISIVKRQYYAFEWFTIDTAITREVLSEDQPVL